MSAVAIAEVPRETIPPAEIAGARLEELSLDLVDVGENVRVDPGELAELAASIAELGVLQPIRAIGPHADGRYRAVWGQRRILASRQAGRTTIPALVEGAAHVDKPGARRSIEQLAENLQRKDLNPIEEARAIRSVLDATKGLTQDALADQLGRSRPWVSNTLALLKAPAAIQEHVRAGALTPAHVKAIGGLPEKRQVELAKRAAADGTSAHDLESEAKWDRQRAADEERRVKAGREASVRAVTALEAAKIEPLAPVWIHTPWNVDSDVVAKAVKTAGYTLGSGYLGWGDRPKACDCIAYRIRIQDGKGTTVEKACVNAKHGEAVEEERRRRIREKSEAEERDREAIRKAIHARLTEQPPHPAIVRLLLRTFDNYAGDSWSEYAKKTDTQALDELAKRISIRHGTAYGKPIPTKTVLAALGVIPDEASAKPARPTKAAAAAKS